MPSLQTLHKFGRNPDVDSASPEHVWEGGGDYTWIATAETVSVVSSDANDTAAGTGARTVTIEGLDSNWDLMSETIVLNGVTPVVSSSSWWRINRAYVATVGTGYVNAGDITGTGSDSSDVHFKITADLGQSQLGFYTVPNGYQLSLEQIYAYAFKQANAAFEVRMRTRENLGPWRLQGTFGAHSQGGYAHRDYRPGLVIPTKTDIEFIAEVSADNCGISVEFDGVFSKL